MRRSCCSALLALVLLLGACATVSVSDERQLGDRFEREARRHFRFVRDRVVVDYVDGIGQAIVAAAGPQPFAYEFAVIDDPEINAFAGPGGRIYVQTGTILAARNASELAGVIAHEVGHVVHRHFAESYNEERAADLGRNVLVIGAGVLGGGTAAGAANLLSGLGLLTVMNTFGREAEREADDFAVQALPGSGYDPNGLPSFFETMIQQGGPAVPGFLSSHPAPADRLSATRAAIAELSLPPGLRVDDGGRLEIIQRRIQLLTGERGPRRRGSR
jgi:predicted Zn-dependent protease